MKVPNDLVDKYAKLFTTNEQWIAVLELIKKSYNLGHDDGKDEMYDEFYGEKCDQLKTNRKII